jgi:hypothetical protein
MRRAAKTDEERNRITHSIWSKGDTPSRATRIQVTSNEKKGLDFQFKRYDAIEVGQVVEGIIQLAYEIQQFWFDLLEQNKLINNPGEKTW